MDGDPEESSRAGGRLEGAEQDPQGGGLPRAVGAQVPEDLAGAQFQVDRVERQTVTEAFGQSLGDDRRRDHGSDRVERLAEVLDQVVRRLDADAEPDEVVGDLER